MTTANQDYYSFLGSDSELMFMVTVPKALFDRNIDSQQNLVDSVILASSLRINFVKDMGEEEDLERYPKPVVLPKLVSEICAVEFCVGDFFPVLIAHKVSLKCRPTGFMTAKSTLRRAGISFQKQIVTKLFSGSFIASKREFELRRKRKAEEGLREAQKKRRLLAGAREKQRRKMESEAKRAERKEINISPNGIENLEENKPSPERPLVVPDLSSSPTPKTSPSPSVIAARRKMVHSMPALNWKRIPLKKRDNFGIGAHRKPRVLPVFAMPSSDSSGSDHEDSRSEFECDDVTVLHVAKEGESHEKETNYMGTAVSIDVPFGSNSPHDLEEFDTHGSELIEINHLQHENPSNNMSLPEIGVSEDCTLTTKECDTSINVVSSSPLPNFTNSGAQAISEDIALPAPLSKASSFHTKSTCVPTSSSLVQPTSIFPTYSRASSLSSLTSFIHDARKIPEKLFGRFWSQSSETEPKPESAHTLIENSRLSMESRNTL